LSKGRLVWGVALGVLQEKGKLAMDRSALRQVLREMVEKNASESVGDFDEATDLRTGLGLDSVDMVTLVMEIQNHLRAGITMAEFECLHSVGDLLDLLQAKLAAQKRAA
jgi:acyl carrier protein